MVDFVLHEREDECQQTDRMHINVFYRGALCNLGKVRLSDLLCAGGHVLEWVYDLGDAHEYTLRVAESVDVTASEDSPVKLQDGFNAPIPINSGSIEKIALRCNTLRRLGQRRGADTAAGAGGGGGGKEELHALALQVPQYLASLVVEHAVEQAPVNLEPETWWETHDGLRSQCTDSALSFDFLTRYGPTFFDLATCEAALRAVTSSSPGAMHSSIFIQTLDGPAESVTLKDRGVAAQRLAWQLEAPRYFNCGIQLALQKCGKCRMVSFFGRACQAAGWPAHKPSCKEFKQ
jgi:hypothetical protein